MNPFGVTGSTHSIRIAVSLTGLTLGAGRFSGTENKKEVTID